MRLTMPNKTLDSKLLEMFKQTLSAKIDIDSECENNINRIIPLLSITPKDIIDSKDLGIDYHDEYFMFLYRINKAIDTTNILSDLITYIDTTLNATPTSYTNFNFIFIVDKLSNKILIEKTINNNDFKKTILSNIKRKTNNSNLKIGDIEYTTIFISNVDTGDFELKIDSRIRSLELPCTNPSFNGYVFTASLFNIVEIYDKLGNELFDKNLRYGINDELQVQAKIKNTLDNNPDKFWFLNNGITMIIKDKDFFPSQSTSLQLQYSNEKDIYVINGAQTISAAAEFFYSPSPTDSITLAKEKAKVMLRIIEINDASDMEIDEVSISLNRQKPIKVEDIAFTTSFVYSINKLTTTDSTSFRLTKRGETTLGDHEYNLVQFSRCVKAYLAQQPGKAMSSGASTLLKLVTNNGITCFYDSSIFKQDILTDDNMTLADFKKYYSPVNLAIELENAYSTFARKNVSSTSSPLQKAALNYGKWHFVAYMIYILNNNNNSDFTNLDINISNLSSIINEYITPYINLFDLVISTIQSSLTSNDFKNNTLYEYFRDYASNYPAETTIINEINSFSNYITSSFKN